ncbi:MAG TPA: pyrroloquinoline quinone precursor peptide PqqA [Xanthobacteraceae bacterium]|nr:pyrroloquinoline quinone precursor peptide PqqA [Xanthobacteraceae bacterium]
MKAELEKCSDDKPQARATNRPRSEKGPEGRCNAAYAAYNFPVYLEKRGNPMAWTTPTLVEICIGLEINGYLPAEF